jgi:GGDEF domain-containing protein
LNVLDIDRFNSSMTDMVTSPVADCLRVVGAVVKSAVREADVVARYGGRDRHHIFPGVVALECRRTKPALIPKRYDGTLCPDVLAFPSSLLKLISRLAVAR